MMSEIDADFWERLPDDLQQQIKSAGHTIATIFERLTLKEFPDHKHVDLARFLVSMLFVPMAIQGLVDIDEVFGRET
jgi:hypothetical protein